MELGDRKEVDVNGTTFYIMCYEPFKAIHTLGELQKLISPIVGKLAGGVGSNPDVLDKDTSDITGLLPALEGAFQSIADNLDGASLERLFKMLLDPNFVSVVDEDGKAKPLSTAMMNKVFIGKTADMFKLAFEVVKANYSDFFTILNTRFGSLGVFTTKNTTSPEN